MSLSAFYKTDTLPFPDRLLSSRTHRSEYLGLLSILDDIWCTHLDRAEFIGSGFHRLLPQDAKTVIELLTSKKAKKVWNKTAKLKEEELFFDDLDRLLAWEES